MRRMITGLVVAACVVAVGSIGIMSGCGGGIPGGGEDACCYFAAVGQLASALLTSRTDDSGRIAVSCWDLDANGKCDLATEDANQDGVCSALDCQGPPGEAGQPIPGTDGLACWDSNGDGVQDANEDINQDGIWNALDCRGPTGPPGSSGGGGQGPRGPAGPELFDLFVNDFFMLDYLRNNTVNALPGYLYAIPTGIPFLHSEEDMVMFAVPIPEYYNAGYPVTLRFFIGGCFPYMGCITLQLNAVRGTSGEGIEPYGETRWVRLDPENPPDDAAQPSSGYMGDFLVVDLPVNVPAPDGLALPDDLETRQMLAFEIRVYEMGMPVGAANYENGYGGIMLAGVEFFESENEGTIVGATVFYAEDYEGDEGPPKSFCDPCQIDSDYDGTVDCEDECPYNYYRTEPGLCGCEEQSPVDTDTDSDGTPDCIDECDEDPDKIVPGDCGCGVPDNLDLPYLVYDGECPIVCETHDDCPQEGDLNTYCITYSEYPDMKFCSYMD